MRLIILSVLTAFTLNVHAANSISKLKECETALVLKDSKSIVLHCISLEKNSQKSKLFVIVAELFQNISFTRINEIFDYGDADPLMARIAYQKKLYSNLEKHYLTEAFNQLQKHNDFETAFIHLLYAKVAYINIMYFQISEGGVSNNSTYELEENLKAKVYIPHMEKYLQKTPNDEETLYLLGMQGLKLTFPLESRNNSMMIMYREVVNNRLYEYLVKSASLNFNRAKLALITVSNWDKYMLRLKDTAESGDKEANYQLGMLNFNNYIDENPNKLKYLNNAILYFDKAQLLGHERALGFLAGIYYSDKPNKTKYTELLVKSIEKYGDGYLSMGNLYWCNGDKIKAKEMYLKAKDKGGINLSEANYALDDLTKLDKPYDGCRFK